MVYMVWLNNERLPKAWNSWSNLMEFWERLQSMATRAELDVARELKNKPLITRVNWNEGIVNRSSPHCVTERSAMRRWTPNGIAVVRRRPFCYAIAIAPPSFQAARRRSGRDLPGAIGEPTPSPSSVAGRRRAQRTVTLHFWSRPTCFVLIVPRRAGEENARAPKKKERERERERNRTREERRHDTVHCDQFQFEWQRDDWPMGRRVTAGRAKGLGPARSPGCGRRETPASSRQIRPPSTVPLDVEAKKKQKTNPKP